MKPVRVGSLFSGYGGLDAGLSLALAATGLPTDVVWHCEVDAAPAAILAHHHRGLPNLGDITAVDWAVIAREAPVDVLAGGFP